MRQLVIISSVVRKREMLAATSLISPLCIERVLTQDGAAHSEAGLSFSVTPFWKDPHKPDIVVCFHDDFESSQVCN